MPYLKMFMIFCCSISGFSYFMAGNYGATAWAVNCLLWVVISDIENRTAN